MPVQYPGIHWRTFDEANPELVGAERGMGLQQKLLANALQNYKLQQESNRAQYYPRLNLAEVNKAEAEPPEIRARTGLYGQQANEIRQMLPGRVRELGLKNQNYTQNVQSQIAYRKALEDQIRYKLNHPGFMSDATSGAEALRQMGLLDENYQPVTRSQPSQQPSQGAMQQAPEINMPPAGLNLDRQIQSPMDAISGAFGQQESNAGNIPAIPEMPPVQQKSISGAIKNEQLADYVSSIMNAPMVNAQYKQMLMRSMQQNLAAKSFTSMPYAEKNFAIAQARALGLTSTEAMKKFISGQTINDLAAEKGFDRNDPSSWPAAKPAPTTAMLTQQERANVAQAGISAIEPFVTRSLAPYVKQWNGTSLQQLQDVMKGRNKEEQGHALAAAQLSIDLQALRARAAGAPIGITLLKEMLETSQSSLKTPGLIRDPEVYKIAARDMRKYISDLNRAENNALFYKGQQEDMAETGSSDNAMSGMSDEELMRIANG
jgi:hypothetical protein